MIKRNLTRSNITAAQRRAQEVFKATMAQKQPSDAEIVKRAFDDNRGRLKAERLAREASTELPTISEESQS